MHTGVKSIHGIISPELLEKLGYDDYRKKEVSDLNFNKRYYSKEEKDRLIDQMIRNNPKDFTKVYEEDMFLAINVKGKDGKYKPLEIIKTNRDLIKAAKKTKEMYFVIDDVEYSPAYIRVYNKRFKKALFYKLVEKNDKTGDLSYKLTSPLGRKAFKIEANPFEDIINSTLPNNNNASLPEMEDGSDEDQKTEMNKKANTLVNNSTPINNNETFSGNNGTIKEPPGVRVEKQSTSVSAEISDSKKTEDLKKVVENADSDFMILNSAKYAEWYDNEIQNNPNLTDEEALEYYKKCKS